MATPPVPPLPSLPKEEVPAKIEFPLESVKGLDPSISSVPLSKLKELLDNQKLLKSYLLDSLQEFNQEIIHTLDENIRSLQNLLQQYEDNSKDIDQLNKSLDELNVLFRRWKQTEIEMYTILQRYQPNSLSKKLFELLEQSHLESQQLVSKLEGSVQESDLQSFIREYRAKRKLYHLRKEKYHRCQEERVRFV
ncbi:Hypothetical protein PP7435_CHR2-1122 [Komagataella phaffii CBS 7435]|uniref:VPS37 C-terminal domain-containing protein n=2 Tax=Komagataella phaffii TaxID=460519 RepID=C4QZW8_KOMPG|nr:Hypothetical protein PAS_chr2-1_0184 [Komagataella phaffii GS115]AOA63130.1 GQ67_00212T0 [Komagataella phaffii]KAI0462693.1 hypothetical protein LJB42_003494 [Komagataella kurtzmanii]CAH2448708.1 Hypothetical protein BQ9382_C2-6025 [Komagataella phaffii CBS 7435]AOA67665.1 GQ68_01176T0 [Komagataella phaffii GS115]CAY68792.1 Hypothetical protein PAS_chr2-1_0184 [Komagataella phaffii GS115]